MDITTSYEEWSAWGACTASCGVMGTQQRTRGCNHTCFLLGMMKFSNQCPIFGIESQVCSGACTQTAASVTLTYPGNCNYYSHFSRFSTYCSDLFQPKVVAMSFSSYVFKPLHLLFYMELKCKLHELVKMFELFNDIMLLNRMLTTTIFS